MISKETKDRIARESELPEYEAIEGKLISDLSAIEQFLCDNEPVDGVDFRKQLKRVIIEAKEAEAERSSGLVDLLAKIRDHLPPKTMFVKEITEALNQYNQPVK